MTDILTKALWHFGFGGYGDHMRKARWLIGSSNPETKPAIYHCISRVLDRRFAFGDDEREHFRMFMRMQENFSGSRVLSYCMMSNNFHILLEVPPMPEGGISDEVLLKRLSAIHTEAAVATVGGGSKGNETVLPDLGMAGMLRHRVRYFTDGAVIGSKAFVSEAFAGARERFTEKRKDGAAAAGVLWSVRDLRLRI